MKDPRFFPRRSPLALVPGVLLALLVHFPALLSAHPGHYHPDETDEFDFFRAFFFHPHGYFDYVLLAIGLGSLALALFNGRPAVRFGALAAGAAALALLPVL